MPPSTWRYMTHNLVSHGNPTGDLMSAPRRAKPTSSVLASPSRYRKALIVALLFAAAAIKVLSDGIGDGTVSLQEWIAAISAGLATLTVFAVPNSAPEGRAGDPAVSETDA